MEVGSPEWIESSLARLEELERQQGEHEAALETATDPAELQKHTAELQRLDEELKGLYAQLEAVAGEDEDEADAPSETMGDDEISRPVEVAPPVAAAAPLAEPVAAAAESPFGAAPAAAADSPFDTSPPLPVDDDLKVGNSSKWVFIALVLVAGLGVGGWFAYQNMVANQPAPEPEKGPTKRIEASAIPDDTEEPNAVQGGDATVSPTAGGGTKAGSGGGGKKKKKTEKKKKKLEIGGSGDPLG